MGRRQKIYGALGGKVLGGPAFCHRSRIQREELPLASRRYSPGDL